MSSPSTFLSSPMHPSPPNVEEDSQNSFTQPSQLWGRLLRKSGPAGSQTPSASFSLHTQIGPQDRANTSTKILLHDTHARLENFSERTDVLVKEVVEAKREMVRAREDITAEHIKSQDELVQLGWVYAHISMSLRLTRPLAVNRSQAMIQKAVGEPAQARDTSDLKAAVASTHDKIHALELRLESVTKAHEQHHHMLEKVLDVVQNNQVHALDQDKKIVELFMPLLTLLQAAPGHVATSRDAVLNKIREQDQILNKVREQERVLDKILTTQQAVIAKLSERRDVPTHSSSSPERPPIVLSNRLHFAPPTSSPAPPQPKKRKLATTQDVPRTDPSINLMQSQPTALQNVTSTPAPGLLSTSSKITPNPKKRKRKSRGWALPSSGSISSDGSRPATVPASSISSSLVVSSTPSTSRPMARLSVASTTRVKKNVRRLSGPGVPPPSTPPPMRVFDGLTIDASSTSFDTARPGFGPTTRATLKKTAPLKPAPVPAPSVLAPAPSAAVVRPVLPRVQPPAGLDCDMGPFNLFRRQQDVQMRNPRTPSPFQRELSMFHPASPIKSTVNGKRHISLPASDSD
ncbi:hypothetical protein OF83DRAFT_1173144 [Amylostereum chailletii]|nr:hypothetical protein OF83DRAFT_1173144 [Amylostereum chailletii]